MDGEEEMFQHVITEVLNSKPEDTYREIWLWCDQNRVRTLGQLACIDELAYMGTYIEYPLGWTNKGKEPVPTYLPIGKRAVLGRISAWITYMCTEKGV